MSIIVHTPNAIESSEAAPVQTLGSPSFDETKTVTTLNSRDLFGTRNSVYIQHDDVVYNLRITRAGKLILTK